MTGAEMDPSLTGSVTMMAAMMLPGAVPAITRNARERGSLLAAPMFASSYLGLWALIAVAIWLVYRPAGAVVAGGLMLVLVAVDVMSIPLMLGIALVVLGQKLLPPRPAVDVPLALAITVLGLATAAT